MAQNSPYCKAYTADKFRAFAGWKEKSPDLKKETTGKEAPSDASQRADADILYLHASYVVTDGIFNDENIVFDNVTEEWKKFCTEQLRFSIPDYKPGTPSTVTK